MTEPASPPIDLGELRAAIREEYEAVASEPGRGYHFHTGRTLAALLGYDEAWIGEHHSAGFEIIACPEIFIAAAAERTRHIRFGTGVVSLPYHHPLMVADRIMDVLVDQTYIDGKLVFEREQ